MDRTLVLEYTRVTEAAAISASAQIGRGDGMSADAAAVKAMRAAFERVPARGTIVIGEGERDEAPMLFIGEKVGKGGPRVDIALDPLEGTTLTAKLDGKEIIRVEDTQLAAGGPALYLHGAAAMRNIEVLNLEVAEAKTSTGPTRSLPVAPSPAPVTPAVRVD